MLFPRNINYILNLRHRHNLSLTRPAVSFRGGYPNSSERRKSSLVRAQNVSKTVFFFPALLNIIYRILPWINSFLGSKTLVIQQNTQPEMMEETYNGPVISNDVKPALRTPKEDLVPDVSTGHHRIVQ